LPAQDKDGGVLCMEMHNEESDNPGRRNYTRVVPSGVCRMTNHKAILKDLTERQVIAFNREPPDSAEREELHQQIVRVQKDRAREGGDR
jgi:hypothetical protein